MMAEVGLARSAARPVGVLAGSVSRRAGGVPDLSARSALIVCKGNYGVRNDMSGSYVALDGHFC